MVDSYNFKGKWICANMGIDDRFAPVFRRELNILKPLKCADAVVCGLGLFELRVNGILPDDTVLNPAHTQYSSTVLYRSFDIASLLREGKNEITVEVGHSFFNETVETWAWHKASWRDAPKLICDINLIYNDGTRECIPSDGSWLVTKDGPIRENSIYYGEYHDYTIKSPVWKSAEITTPPAGALKPQNMPPIRRINSFKPAGITCIGNNSYVIKAPEMVTGWAKISMDIPCGHTITVTYGETLLSDGRVVHIGKGEGRDGKWFPKAYIQQDRFTADGVIKEFEPKFSYKGFRYFQIDNCPCEPTSDNITIYRVANDVERVSEFECSCELVNQLHTLMGCTILNNLQGKPTDTPVWEKNGWLGDLNCGLWSMVYSFDMNTFLQSFTNTMADCFTECGMVPVMVPAANWGMDNNPVWNTAFVFCAEALLDYYGEVDYVKGIYPVLKAYALKQVEEIRSRGWVWDEHTLADWLAPIGGSAFDEADPNSSEGAEICAGAFIYKMLRAMAHIADTIGEQADIFTYPSELIRAEFNKKFYDTELGIYRTTFWKQRGQRTRYRQTSNLLPLAFGMVEHNERPRVLSNLVKDIQLKEYHLDTGCIGTRFVLPVLFDNGYGELAYKVLTQTTYPSWGYWLCQGFDTAWESWENTTRSYDHYFLATYDEALFTHLAGIRDVKNGFGEFTFDPKMNCGLSYLKLKLKTPKGIVKCAWEHKDGICRVKLCVPAGVTVHTKLSENDKCEFRKEII